MRDAFVSTRRMALKVVVCTSYLAECFMYLLELPALKVISVDAVNDYVQLCNIEFSPSEIDGENCGARTFPWNPCKRGTSIDHLINTSTLPPAFTAAAATAAPWDGITVNTDKHQHDIFTSDKNTGRDLALHRQHVTAQLADVTEVITVLSGNMLQQCQVM